MRTRMYGGVRGRKTKVGGKPTFVFLLLYYWSIYKYTIKIFFEQSMGGIELFRSIFLYTL